MKRKKYTSTWESTHCSTSYAVWNTPLNLLNYVYTKWVPQPLTAIIIVSISEGRHIDLRPSTFEGRHINLRPSIFEHRSNIVQRRTIRLHVTYSHWSTSPSHVTVLQSIALCIIVFIIIYLWPKCLSININPRKTIPISK